MRVESSGDESIAGGGGIIGAKRRGQRRYTSGAKNQRRRRKSSGSADRVGRNGSIRGGGSWLKRLTALAPLFYRTPIVKYWLALVN